MKMEDGGGEQQLGSREKGGPLVPVEALHPESANRLVLIKHV